MLSCRLGAKGRRGLRSKVLYRKGVVLMPQYRFRLLTASGRILQTPRSEFDNDDHAIVFADGLLRATEPQVTAVEAWHETNLLFKQQRGERQAAPPRG